jgi:integrase/recombinase XerD
MINPVPQGFVGSNPTSSIESSVRRKNQKEFEGNSTGVKSLNDTESLELLPRQRLLRDVYNRKEKLDNCIRRINTELGEPDRGQVLAFVEYMQDEEKSILWIVRCTTAILLMRKQLGKTFEIVRKEDVRSLFKWMESKNYKASSHEKFRIILKMFYKFTFGNNDYYPDCVKWFSVSVGKEKFRHEKILDIEEYLEEDEIKILVDTASTIQKKAFIACMYESGARPEEFLTLTNRDLMIDTNGIILILRGKTGERRVRIIAFSSLLQHWLSIHPLKDQQEFSLWISEASKYKNN